MTDKTNPLVMANLKSANQVLLSDVVGVELAIKVSDVKGIKSFAFSFDGVPIPAARRKFIAQPGETKLLQWIMIGPGGSSMVVKVMNGDVVVAERKPSRIPSGFTSAFDLFEIMV